MTAEATQPSILVRGLSKQYSRRAVLRGLDFQAYPGEFVVLLGANGAGKTTFLRLLATLTRPTQGEITLGGHRLPGAAAEARRLVGFVSHLPLLYGELSAAENLHFFGRLYGLPDLARRVEEGLRLVGLYERCDSRVSTFSRGMQQRLSIARAVLHDPLILLMDEPYTGLDLTASEVLDRVLQQVTARRRTLVMTTHDVEHAARLGTRFDVLQGGRIAASMQAAGLMPQAVREFYEESLKHDIKVVIPVGEMNATGQGNDLNVTVRGEKSDEA
jgi:heme exporter protein A